MKKFLLSALMLLATVSAFATTDGQTYEAVNGFKCVNTWILDRFHTPSIFSKADYCSARARTAVMSNGVIYIPRSEAIATIVPKADGTGNDTISQSVVYRLDAKTGESLTTLNVTLDGSPYGVFLGVNSIGVDNFGHLWVAPYTSEKATEVPFYQLDGETGALTLIANLKKGDKIARTDYYDVIGDITRKEAECNVMNAGTQVDWVYRWHADKGATDFEGGFDGDLAISITDFFPETVTQWSYGPTIKMCASEDEDTKYAGELFYVDGFNSVPALYDVTGSLIDSYEEVPTELYPETGTNGVTEFQLKDDKGEQHYFMVYSIAQYAGTGHGCQSNIVELGEGQSLGGMKKYWQIPADSLGQTSDGGNRVHSFNVEYGTENGAPCATLFTFKSYNGMAIYKIGTKVEGGDTPEPSVKGDVNGDGKVDTSDLSALMAVILNNGSAADNPSADVNGDGKVDTTDLSALITIILGA